MMRGSSYLGSAPKRALSRPRRFGSLAAVFLIFAVLLSSLATLPFLDSIFGSRQALNPSVNSTSFLNDAAAWCSDPKEGNLGLGMDNRSDWKSGSAWYPHADTSGRVLTAQEAFGNGVGFTNFNGVGESPGLPWFWISPPIGLPQSDNDTKEKLNSVVSYTGNTPKGEGADNWYKNMNSSRTPTKCVLGNVGASVANGILGITTGVTNLMGGISTFAFDPHFICEPNSGATNCIDLVGIIGGGGGSSEGIIGKLTSSVYFPLLTLAALLVGVYIIWNGLAKRQFRETFFGVLWSLVVTILGIAMLLNPLMLAKAPMVVGNALTSCIVGAFTGSGGCAGDNSPGNDSTKTEYCIASSSRNDFMDKAAITMTSMSCELWKAFVLQPYAQGSFGAPLDQLNANDSNTVAGKLVAKNPGFDKNTFCVDTKVQGVLDQRFGKRLELVGGGNKICNLAIYQAYLAVDAHVAGGDAVPPSNSIDGRWLKLAQVAASDEGMYRSWAPSDWHLAQIGMAVIGLISAILAAIVIFVVAAFALAFYITSILMIAFAPFFLLAGVHPGRGRKMMVGWIGQVLSNVMKYAASAIFLVITVSLYGAVLSNVSNPGAILIFMIILTVALLMYRREIVDMIGVIDLGGEKLSNKFAEKTMDRVKNTGKTAMAVGAGVTAGALSNGALNPFRVDNWTPKGMARNTKDMFRAGNDSFRRSVKSRPGTLGEVMKASDRISADNRADMVKQSTAAADTARRATQDRSGAEERYESLNNELNTSHEATEEKLATLQDRKELATSQQFERTNSMNNLQSAQITALGAIDSSAFREYQGLLNQLKDLEIKAVIAEESGNVAEAQSYRNSAQSLQNDLAAAESRLTDEDRSVGQSQYNSALASTLAVDDPRVTSDNVESYQNYVQGKYQEVMSTIGNADAKSQALKDRQIANESELKESIALAREELADARGAESNATKAADRARQNVIDLKPGQVVKNTDVRKNEREIAAMQNDRSDDVAAAASVVQDRMIQRSEDLITANNSRMNASEEVRQRQEAVSEVQDRGRQIVSAQKDMSKAREAALASMRSQNPQTPEGAEQVDFVAYEEAERTAREAAQRAATFTARQQAEGTLSQKDQADLFIAKRVEEESRKKMEVTSRKLEKSGTDVSTMREKLKAAIEDEYAKTASSMVIPMEDDLDSFNESLASAAKEVEAEARSRQEALRQAQEEERRAAQAAERARAEATELANTAARLQNKASSEKPIGPRKAARITDKVEKKITRSKSRGLPTSFEDQNSSADEALPVDEILPETTQEKPRRSDRDDTRSEAKAPQNATELKAPPRQPRGISPTKPTDNTPGADDGNPFRGGNPFRNQR